MKSLTPKLSSRVTMLSVLCMAILFTNHALARVGGAGGHGGGSGGHSSGGHSGGYSGGYGHSSGGYYGNGGGGGGGIGFIVLIIVVAIIILIIKNIKPNTANPTQDLPPSKPFPDGLDANKVAHSFMAIQDAWQRQDLKEVRKWLSDGMYQRLTTQFRMMQLLGQSNILSNIRIHGISAGNSGSDSQYRTAEVAIAFSIDDSFVSNKYPQFNESFRGDTATEYWTFIKRADSAGEKNLYDNNNCPNCGALFEVKMGEISRCSNCNTLTNSAAYDWVLSEITQSDDYTGGAGLSHSYELRVLMAGDPFFAVQRMEDIASNVFMQVAEVLAGKDKKRLTRFSEPEMAQAILAKRESLGLFLWDRMYLNAVTLAGYTVDGDLIRLTFDITYTYRRVRLSGNTITMLDPDFVTDGCTLELSRNKNIQHKATTGETVFSYECSACGAPFTDTTHDKCTYCDAPVVDKQTNWVLTNLAWQAGHVGHTNYNTTGSDNSSDYGTASLIAGAAAAMLLFNNSNDENTDSGNDNNDHPENDNSRGDDNDDNSNDSYDSDSNSSDFSSDSD